MMFLYPEISSNGYFAVSFFLNSRNDVPFWTFNVRFLREVMNTVSISNKHYVVLCDLGESTTVLTTYVKITYEPAVGIPLSQSKYFATVHN